MAPVRPFDERAASTGFATRLWNAFAYMTIAQLEKPSSSDLLPSVPRTALRFGRREEAGA
jgi:hypothetical protein